MVWERKYGRKSAKTGPGSLKVSGYKALCGRVTNSWHQASIRSDTMTASINELTRYGVIPLKQNYAVKVTECEGLQKNVDLLGCAKSLLITSHLAPDHSMHLTRERLALHTPKGPCKEEKTVTRRSGEGLPLELRNNRGASGSPVPFLF